jgi:hypothetical protein
MARPKRVASLPEKWYVYNWLMCGYDAYSGHTRDGKLLVKDVQRSYSAGARGLALDGTWMTAVGYGASNLFHPTTWSEVEQLAEGRYVELVDCRRPHS